MKHSALYKNVMKTFKSLWVDEWAILIHDITYYDVWADLWAGFDEMKYFENSASLSLILYDSQP